MTTPTPEPGTALAARRPSLTERMLEAADAESRILAFQTASRRHRTEILQQAAADLANTQWGMALAESTRFGVARWALEAGIDPVRHVYVLGGKIYDNAELYIDKLASLPEFLGDEELILAPLDRRPIDDKLVGVERARLLRQAQEAMNAERLQQQMAHGVPDNINEYPESAAAVLVRLHFRGPDGQTVTVEGVNWAGSRGRRKRKRGPDGQMREGGPVDPVGDQEPIKTARTRAYRKAAKKKVPVWFKQGAFGDAFEQAEVMIEQGKDAIRRSQGESIGRYGKTQVDLNAYEEAIQGSVNQIEAREEEARDGQEENADPGSAVEAPARETAAGPGGTEATDQAAAPPQAATGPGLRGPGDAFRCARCLNTFPGAPTSVGPGVRGQAKYCADCTDAMDREREAGDDA